MRFIDYRARFLSDAKDKADLFPTTEKQCTIKCSRKWKSISSGAGRRIPYQWTFPWDITMEYCLISYCFSSGS
jgi:hypothetical protein